jgi:hypothetical protein
MLENILNNKFDVLLKFDCVRLLLELSSSPLCPVFDEDQYESLAYTEEIIQRTEQDVENEEALKEW